MYLAAEAWREIYFYVRVNFILPKLELQFNFKMDHSGSISVTHLQACILSQNIFPSLLANPSLIYYNNLLGPFHDIINEFDCICHKLQEFIQPVSLKMFEPL